MAWEADPLVPLTVCLMEPSTPFPVGTRIVLHGLLARSELNGTAGIILSNANGSDGGGRYEVRLSSTGEIVALKPKNVMLPPAPPSPECFPENGRARVPVSPMHREPDTPRIATGGGADDGIGGGSSATIMAEVAALRLRVAELEAEASGLRGERDRWRLVTGSLINKVMLSPDSCEFYKRTVREQLANALRGIDHAADYIDCSFPSSPSNAPCLRLTSCSGSGDRAGGAPGSGAGAAAGAGASAGSPGPPGDRAGRTAWYLSWKPNWACQVQCSSRKAGVRYSVTLRVSNFEILGTLMAHVSEDASKVSVQFAGAPDIRMTLASTVSLGPAIPMPVRALLDRAVRDACTSFVQRNLVAKPTVVEITKLRRKTELTDADLAFALNAALEAAKRC